MSHLDFPLEVKALSDEGTFEGYGAIFGNVDFGGDKITPGAFIKGLAENRRTGSKVVMLWHHDTMEPIGTWDDLAEDGKGLWGKGRLVMEVPRARQTHALMKAGALSGLSIGYEVKEGGFTRDKGVRILTELNLKEVSPVTFPMNDRARVTGVKADLIANAVKKLAEGELPTKRELEAYFEQSEHFSNSQAERAARTLLKGQGEPVAAATGADFLSAFLKT